MTNYNTIITNLIKLTSLLQLVDKLQQAGKIDNWQEVWRYSLCIRPVVNKNTCCFAIIPTRIQIVGYIVPLSGIKIVDTDCVPLFFGSEKINYYFY